MDDFNVSSLHESKNEWGARLLTILTPLLIEGLKSIFDESHKLCKSNNEMDKYLMTFQNFITRIPNWNPVVIEQEKKRIIEKSHCEYLEELVTCVHIIQLKLLTAMRVGQKQKKIDISIPKLDDFIHKCYINVARKIYKNVYLFEINIPPLQVQKYNRELEIIIQECILNTIRDSIPIENILKAYMDETVEEDVIEEIKEQTIQESLPINAQGETTFIGEGKDLEKDKDKEKIIHITPETNSIKFNDLDSAININNTEELINAPKNIERLEEISNMRNTQRKLEEEQEQAEENVKLQIHNQDAELSNLDVHVINQPDIQLDNDFLLDDIEILT
jgi:hypothetical protein